LATLVSKASVQAANLKPEVVEQCDDYIREVEARLAPRFQGEHFCGLPSAPRLGTELRQGRSPLNRRTTKEINGGMIQDWQGPVFIKGAKLDSVPRVVQDYANPAKYYSPDVVTSKVVSHTGDHWLVVMRTLKTKLFLSDVLETENDITFEKLERD
jgi:hypothetical protein